MVALFCLPEINSDFNMKSNKKRMVIFAGEQIDNNQKNK